MIQGFVVSLLAGFTGFRLGIAVCIVIGRFLVLQEARLETAARNVGQMPRHNTDPA